MLAHMKWEYEYIAMMLLVIPVIVTDKLPLQLIQFRKQYYKKSLMI
ncbi:hypothetical protein CPS_2087 [Colwellia psychrerythraea 34H]|uniref:Uncharacterized protein n=1 Tax=Colwellia psychrerythraea (strain 34H / ATCC BAA-681) TaxID=167879 RepID=Q483F3_COLP3|nr:hypothetical protein CPS_2087 [Colwellia psychrerythraea 34H]